MIRCAACRPITSISIKFIGRTLLFHLRRQRPRCTSFTDKGKIRAIGVSNYSLEQMKLFQQAAPLHTAQPPYNLFERDVERDVLPYCHTHGISTLTYGSLCRGLLSGKIKMDTEFQGDDVRKIDPKFQPPRYAQYLKAVERARPLCPGELRQTRP